MFPTDQTFDGSDLRPVWNGLDLLDEELVKVDDWFGRSVEFTDRRLDSADRAGQRLYIIARGLISLAREHQHLLQRTMAGPDGAVYPHATLNLIRPSYEAALTALWICESDDSQERKLRGLRQAWEDHRQSSSWANDLTGFKWVTEQDRADVIEQHSSVGTNFRQDAQELGIPWPKVSQKINLVDEIPKLSTFDDEPDVAQYLRLTWRQLSGVQHSLSYASLRSGKRLGDIAIPGGRKVTLVTDDDWLKTACRASSLVQAWAMSTYLKRTTTMSHRLNH